MAGAFDVTVQPFLSQLEIIASKIIFFPKEVNWRTIVPQDILTQTNDWWQGDKVNFLLYNIREGFN